MLEAHIVIAGIDYGSKLAGTTAMAVLDGSEVRVFCSEKNKSADSFLKGVLGKYTPTLVGFDAPLSLPGVYRGLPDKTDYFYRECDQLMGAMSPMFLGGLTARAMALVDELKGEDVLFIETYPKKAALLLGLGAEIYKKDNSHITTCLQTVIQATGWQINTPITNWHMLDTLLALYSAVRYNGGIAVSAGDEEEGVIYY